MSSRDNYAQNMHLKTKRRSIKLTYLKLSGVVREIIKRYPNIDVTDFLQEKLQIPDYKAEELAARIEKEIIQKENKSGKYLSQLLDKPDESELLKTSVYSVDSLSEREFERFAKWLLEEVGFEIHPEKYSINYGAYLIAIKDGKKIVILIKKMQRNSKVSNSVILKSQEIKSTYSCSGSIVVTTSYFSLQAKVDAQKFDVELWDRDTLEAKISEVRKKAELEEQTCFPPFKGSLLRSLLRLDETKDFIIESKAEEKYDLHLPGVKYPLLTFQAYGDLVVKCVFRIKYNEPVGEFVGEAIINTDHSSNRSGPDGQEAYTLIIKYLEQFME
jgi:HJR/Mrr/RecB family endonuclease